MKRGLWPINPLAAPTVVRLAESLPTPWRAGKHLLRQRLADTGFSADVVRPSLQENFHHILRTAMKRHGAHMLEDILDDGALLVSRGYLDERELRTALRVFTSTGKRLYEVSRPLMLELALRGFSNGCNRQDGLEFCPPGHDVSGASAPLQSP